jgi:chaperonin GroES
MLTEKRPIKWLLEAPDKSNLADELTSKELSYLGQEVVRLYRLDRNNRQDWDALSESALKLAKQVRERKTTPWDNCSNVKHPLITVSTIQFAARAYPEICKGSKVVKCQITGDDPPETPIQPQVPQQIPGQMQTMLPLPGQTPAQMGQMPLTIGVQEKSPKRQRADRIETHMNFQLTQEMVDWESDMDTLLHVLPVVGQCYKKTYFDPELDHNVSELVLPDDCVVSKSKIRDIKKARRISHRLWIYDNDAQERMRADIWREVSLGVPPLASQDTDAPHEFIEQHCWYDLDGDGYKEPYIITVHLVSVKVVRVLARWQMESVIADRKNEVKKIIPDHYFTHFGFIPNPDGSINYLGFGQLLEPINSSVNTVLNQLIDSGTLYNTGGGFLGRGIRMRGGTYTFQPGEYKTVDCPGGALKENIVPLPTREPSVVLFQLLGFLVQAGKEISSVQDVLTGDAKLAATMPVGTMMALVEQGLKVFTAIYKRIYRSLSEEFKKLYYLNARYLDPVTSFYVSGNKNRVELSDYRADDTLVMPVADPDLSSDMQRLLKGQALKDLTGRPGLNEVAITRQLVRAIRPENMHEVLMTDAQMSGKEPIPWAPPPNPQVILAQAKANHLNARAQESALQLQMSLQKFELETEALLADIENKKADTMLKLAKAEAAEAGLQLQQYEAEMNHISEQVKARMDVVKERIKAFAQQQKQLADQEGMTEVLESDQGGMEGRAFGGPVDRGNPFVVGELGPELYVPSGSNDNQELSKLMGILNQNKNLEYVRRILAPYNSPVKVYDDDGTIASHMMMYSDHPGGRGYISFPSIVNDEEGFRELSPDEAYRHAVRSRQYIQHPTREEADWFSKNYKKVWGPIQ